MKRLSLNSITDEILRFGSDNADVKLYITHQGSRVSVESIEADLEKREVLINISLPKESENVS